MILSDESISGLDSREPLFSILRKTNDNEKAAYLMVAELQKRRKRFARKILYPYLPALLKLRRSLLHVINNSSHETTVEISGGIRKVNSERSRMIWDFIRSLSDYERENMLRLITHLAGQVEKVVREGQKIKKEVKNNLFIDKLETAWLNPLRAPSRGTFIGYDENEHAIYEYLYFVTQKEGITLERECRLDLPKHLPPSDRDGFYRECVGDKVQPPVYAVKNCGDPLPFNTALLVGKEVFEESLAPSSAL